MAIPPSAVSMLLERGIPAMCSLNMSCMLSHFEARGYYHYIVYSLLDGEMESRSRRQHYMIGESIYLPTLKSNLFEKSAFIIIG